MNIRNEIEIMIKVARGTARNGNDNGYRVLHELQKTWTDIRGRFPLPIQPADMAEGLAYLSEAARENLKRSADAILKVDHAFGWGLLGFDLLADALEALLTLPTLPGERDDRADAFSYASRVLRRPWSVPPMGPLVDPDLDGLLGGGPFGRALLGTPPEGFAGPLDDEGDSEAVSGRPMAPERVVAPPGASGDVFPGGASGVRGWIGVDFDGTLATGDRPWPEIGDPVPAMMRRVRAWLAAGIEVRIVTVRAGEGQAGAVGDWLVAHGLPRLMVTDRKSVGMFQLWDDRAVRVERDTGRVLGPEPEAHKALGRP